MTAEVAVVGGGPAGLVCAIALATAGVDTLRHRAARREPDNRTTALLAGSVTALETLGVWPSLPAARRPAAQDPPHRRHRNGSFARPKFLFDAAEIGLDAFGHNIENRHLVDGARSACRGAEACAHYGAGARDRER